MDSFFLQAISEIFQAILFEHQKKLQAQSSHSSDDLMHLIVRIKDKGQINQNGQNIFSLKVTSSESVPWIHVIEGKCAPCLTEIICHMQKQAQESHLTLQTDDDGEQNCEKTAVLWLDSSSDVSSVTVKTLSETCAIREGKRNYTSVLQLRVFMDSWSMIQCSKGICELIERTKFLNPHIQLSFSLDFGGTVIMDLRDTVSRRCGIFTIYTGSAMFSEKFDLATQIDVCLMSPVVLRCVLYFTPLSAKESPCDNGDFAERRSKSGLHQQISGKVRKLQIQVYGPAGMPFDMNIVTKTMSLCPAVLVPWHQFGMQVKTSVKCGSYNLHCAARIINRDVLSPWVTAYPHFCLTLAFVVDVETSLVSEASRISQRELFQSIEDEVLVEASLATFQAATFSALSDLLVPDKSVCTEQSTSHLPDLPHKSKSSDLYEKMIPEVVTSLVDIFTKSTNSQFRSQISSLVPTLPRMSMSCHLEESLQKMITNPAYAVKNNASSPQLRADKSDEAVVDDWKLSGNNQLSPRGGDDQGYSPETSYSRHCGEAQARQLTSDLVHAGSFNTLDHTESSSLFDNVIDDEEEIEIWRQMADISSNFNETRLQFDNMVFPSAHPPLFPKFTETEEYSSGFPPSPEMCYREHISMDQHTGYGDQNCVYSPGYVSQAKIPVIDNFAEEDDKQELENLFQNFNNFSEEDDEKMCKNFQNFSDEDDEYMLEKQFAELSTSQRRESFPQLSITFVDTEHTLKDQPYNSIHSYTMKYSGGSVDECETIAATEPGLLSACVNDRSLGYCCALSSGEAMIGESRTSGIGRAGPFNMMTRKRSSEYMDNHNTDVCDEFIMSSCGNISVMDGTRRNQCESKKQKFGNVDVTREDNHEQMTCFYADDRDGFNVDPVISRPETNARSSHGRDVTAGPERNGEDEFSDWFDEDEVANWCAEMM